MLEYRFKHVAEGHEKYYILELLRTYYPILQKDVLTTVEVTELKNNLAELESECLHLNTTKEPNRSFVFKCDDCGKTIYM